MRPSDEAERCGRAMQPSDAAASIGDVDSAALKEIRYQGLGSALPTVPTTPPAVQ